MASPAASSGEGGLPVAKRPCKGSASHGQQADAGTDEDNWAAKVAQMAKEAGQLAGSKLAAKGGCGGGGEARRAEGGQLRGSANTQPVL